MNIKNTALTLLAIGILLVPTFSAVTPQAKATHTTDVTVTIVQFQEIQNPDPGPFQGCCGDYYAKVRIDAFGFQDTFASLQDNVADISPNWMFTRTVDTSTTGHVITIVIQIFDDDVLTAEPDDIIDLNPIDGVVDLTLAYDTTTGTWTGDVPMNQVTSQGDGDHEQFGFTEGGEAGRITFNISMPDFDGDGIPDSVELFGLSDSDTTLVGDPCRKSIAVEIDFMESAGVGHTHRPQAAAITELINAFNAAPVPSAGGCPYGGYPTQPTGVNLLIDVDDPIPEQATMNFGSGFETTRDGNFSAVRRPWFHYSLWVHDLNANDSTSGVCCSDGKDFLVSLGSWTNNVGTVRQQSGTFMHEFGHSLGLGHGGGDGINFKPNYLSVMSYRYQTVGITGVSGTPRLDYSRQQLSPLNETALVESAGIGDGVVGTGDEIDFTVWNCPTTATRTGRGDGPLDWNCSDGVSPIDASPVINDINGDRVCIKPGDDGTLDSTAASDDVVTGSQIWDGPNRTCDSAIAGGSDDDQVRPVTDVQTSVLNGFDDWSSLNYPAGFAAGGAAIPEHVDLNFPDAQLIETLWEEFFTMQVTKFFTDPDLNPLPSDTFGNPKVDVVLANGKVKGTNPGQVVQWVRVTNTLGHSIESLAVNETLPVDWSIQPAWRPSGGPVHVFFEFANGTRLEITDPATIIATSGNPQTVLLSIRDIPATVAGKGVDPGQSILLSIKIGYVLKGTSQAAASYPRNYTDVVTATGFPRPLFNGSAVPETASGFFIAYAKVLGDVNLDFRVDIADAGAVGRAFGSRPSDTRWNANADLDGNGIVDILDLALVAYYYGTKS